MTTGTKGALMQLLLQKEASFRAGPAAPGAQKVPFTSYKIGRDPKKVADPSISASPLPGKTGAGDATVEGSIDAILDLRSIGWWLMFFLGVPTANKAVTQQPTNVTGVTINYAQTAAPSGDGTLEWTAVGTTLTWTAQGETAGTPVDVSAGGYFTIPSGTGSHGIHVTVSAAALPVGDETDSDITVSSTLKCHVYPIDLNDRPTALAELGHTDISKFYRTLGLFVNEISYDLTAPDQNVTIGCLAGEETEYGAVYDASPTSYDSVRSAGALGFMGNGVDSALGTITAATFKGSNNAKGKPSVDGREGYGFIDQGEMSMGGTLEVLFNTTGAYQLARASTSTRLRLGSANANGFGLWWDFPNAEFIETMVPKEGKTAIMAKLNWAAHRVSSGVLPLCTLINDIPSYS